MKDIYQEITDRFIDALKQGGPPWCKNWTTTSNFISKKSYRGINELILSIFQKRYDCNFWLTFNQAKQLGGSIRKGEKGVPIVFWKLIDKNNDGNEDVEKIPFIRYSNVFNLEQTEGIEIPKQDHTPLESPQKIVDSINWCKINHGGDRAAYNSTLDVIKMPKPEHFKKPEDYYMVFFHEAAHATGHESRLNRKEITQNIQFGSPGYAREELVAELGAAFLGNKCGILNSATFDNSTAYLNSWIKALSDDPKLLIHASSHARKAADFIEGISEKEVLNDKLAPWKKFSSQHFEKSLSQANYESLKISQ